MMPQCDWTHRAGESPVDASDAPLDEPVLPVRDVRNMITDISGVWVLEA